jgi:hypothetical protein
MLATPAPLNLRQPYPSAALQTTPETLQPLITQLQDPSSLYTRFISSNPLFAQKIGTKERIEAFSTIFFQLLPEVIAIVNSNAEHDTLRLEGVTRFVILKKQDKSLTIFHLLKELQRYEDDRKTTPCLELTAQGLQTVEVTVFQKTLPCYPENALNELDIRNHPHLGQLFPAPIAVHPESYSFFHELTAPICLSKSITLKGKDCLASSLIYLFNVLRINNAVLISSFSFNDFVICKKGRALTLCLKDARSITVLDSKSSKLIANNLFQLGLLLTQIYTLRPLTDLRAIAIETNSLKKIAPPTTIEPLELPAPLLDTTASHFSDALLSKMAIPQDQARRVNQRLKLFEQLLNPTLETPELLTTMFNPLQTLKEL